MIPIIWRSNMIATAKRSVLDKNVGVGSRLNRRSAGNVPGQSKDSACIPVMGRWLYVFVKNP